MQIGDIVLRSVVSLGVLFFVTRMMGKKQISQLTFFDYVIGISIGSISAEMALNRDIPYGHGITAVVVYGLLALLISIWTNKSIAARRFFTGHAFLLIHQGKILEKNLMKARYDINDLLSEARNAGFFDIEDVEDAVLETNGKISFLPKSAKSPVTAGDLNIVKQQETLCANVIIDGRIMRQNLHMAGLDEKWLLAGLKQHGDVAVREIVLATVNVQKQLNIYRKTGTAVQRTCMD